MNKTLIALTLMLATTSTFANGFAPWNDRGIDTPDARQVTPDMTPFYLKGVTRIANTPDAVQLPVAIGPWYLQAQKS